jgi:hypothetical protein
VYFFVYFNVHLVQHLPASTSRGCVFNGANLLFHNICVEGARGFP